MDITYLGHSSFKLSGSTAKIITDPFDPEKVGLKFAKTEGDAVTVSHSHDDHNKIDLVGGDPLVIDFPGEYEKKGVRITGFESYHDDKKGEERGKNTIYKIEIDDVSVLHCGDLGHALSNELIEEIGEVDVLLVPTGGHYTISAEDAVKVVRGVEPKIVIPMHYQVPGLKLENELAPVAAFLSAMGAATAETLPKLTVKKSELLDENLRVVVLEA